MTKISKNKEIINSNIIQGIQNLESLKQHKYQKLIFEVFKVCLKAIKNQKKIIFCGNGGSAADSQHLTAELVSKFLKVRKPLPAIALTTNTSTLTSVGNDFGYDYIFSKQLSALGAKGDVLIALSTSGKSKNVIEVLKIAKQKGLFTVLFTGKKIKKKKNCDLIFNAPATRVDRIQEIHILAGHILCELIEKEI
jgi:D-sedoheptulose 7-phosphate isomerase